MARATAIASSLLLCAVVLTCAAVDAASHSAALDDWMREQKIANCREDNLAFIDHSVFLDKGDKMFLEDLPNADYSQGGVHFFGTSNLAVALTPWRHPPKIRARVSNFALGGATHTDQLNLIRYLAEFEGLFQDPENTLVVLALFYGNAVHANHTALAKTLRFAQLFPDKCERYGLFEYGRRTGLHPVEMHPLRRAYIQEKARCMGFLQTLAKTLVIRDGAFDVLPDFTTHPAHDPERYQQKWTRAMGQNWQQGMAMELKALTNTIDYVRDRGASVQAVLMPVGSWHSDLPFTEAYRIRVTRICTATEVPLLDLSQLLEDEDFADHSHVRILPAFICDDAMMAIALDFMQLPPEASSRE